MKGKKLNDITPAEWDEASRKALANLAKQKKLSAKMARLKTSNEQGEEH